VVKARIRAFGVTPRRLTAASDISSSTAAPSEICEELPAVSRPSGRKLLLRVASFSAAVPGRMVSSALNSATVGSAQSLSFSALTGTGRFPGEVARLGCRGSSLVAAHGEGVQRFAAELPVLGDPLGRFALAGQLVALGGKPAEGFAVDFPVAAHAHAAHVLGAASNDDLGTAGGDQPGADMHGHFAGAAFAVNRQAGMVTGQPAPSRAVRAMLADCSPTWVTQPKMTSLTSSVESRHG
jgi:hypothetical protein